MRNARSIIRMACSLAGALGLSACSTVSSSIPVSIAFMSAPPASLQVGKPVTLAAVVSNGSSNSGVNWTVTCGSAGACGGFNPAQTTSGLVTTYTAPTSVPAGNMVTVTATSTDDRSKFVSAIITITTGAVVSVTFAPPPPPTTLTISMAAMFTASVTNDPLSAGVDWTAACGGPGACGLFSPAHTASGAATSYTAPGAVPSGTTVKVTATSTTDPSKMVSASISISNSPPSSFLNGNYAFVLSGSDANGQYGIAGVLRADGMGLITGGEQDFDGFGIADANDTFTGSYSIGPDGRGTITLNTGDPFVGVNGTETLSVVLVSSSHALITEFDSSATSSGTMDLQTVTSFSSSTLSGGYNFVLSGQDLNSVGSFFLHLPFALGGILNVNSPGSISGAGSVVDSNDNGSLNVARGVSGSVSIPDSLGRVDITLSLSFFSAKLGMVGYIADAAHLKLVEVDGNLGVTSGVAVGQGAKTGTFTQPSAFAGNFVFTAFGAIAASGGPVALAASFSSDSATHLQSGPFDVNAGGVPSNGTVSGSYSVDPAGTGRVMVKLSGVTGGFSSFAVYLTGSSDPPQVMEVDGNGVTSGFAYQQGSGPFSASSFQGPYGLNFTIFTPSGSVEADVTGQALADGVGNLVGTWDFNGNGAPSADVPFTGGFAANSNGRFTGSMDAPSVLTGSRQFAYYIVNGSQIVLIETDNSEVGLGVFELQSPPL